MNGTQLKWIAMVSMVIDHIGVAFRAVLPPGWFLAMRIAGRLAFPLYCFLLVEGWCHTGNRRRYAASLALFGLISEVPYNLMASGRFFYPDAQNVYFTLALGLAAIRLAEWGEERNRKWLSLLLCAGILGAAYLLRTDYDAAGVILILVIWYTREEGHMKYLGPFLILATYGWPGFLAILAVPLLALYNGERGKVKAKYFYYAFYPIHLAVIGCLRVLLTQA